MGEVDTSEMTFRISKQHTGYQVTGKKLGFNVTYTISDLDKLEETIEQIKQDYTEYHQNYPE